MSRRKPKLFETAARAKSPVLASGKAPRSAVARAERAVLRAAVAFCRSATALEPLAKLENAVDRLRAARDSFESAKLTTGEFNEP